MKPSDNESNSYFKRNYHHLLLYFILAVGAFFRIYGFWDWSLTNDELSALSRLAVDSLSELIDQGIKPDGHPAVTQLFLYYWVKVFGDSVFAVRFPFVISGIGSLIYFYLSAKNWFNKKAALLASVVFACSQLLILYAQIARPYAFGLFFLMAFNYYWTQLVFQKKKNSSNSFGFIIFAALGIMTHYFATLSVMIQLFLGIFLLSKKDIKQYLINLAITALICLSHLGISLQHLQIGGLSWLPLPSSDFYGKFIRFSFNHSTLWIALIALGIMLPFVSKSLKLRWKRVLAILLMAFLPFWIGYEYSINYSPVLQRSVLIFSFPFLILLFFSLIGEKLKPQLLIAYYTLLFLVGFYSLMQTNLLKEKPFANFMAVAENVIEWKDKYGEQLLSFSNANSPVYFNYYFKNRTHPINFSIKQFESKEKIALARDLIEKTNAKYLSLSFGNFPIPAEVHEFAKQKFPQVIEKNRYYNSEAILYGKSSHKRELIFQSYGLDTTNKNWNINLNNLNDSMPLSPPHAYKIDSLEEYALTYKSKVGKLSNSNNQWITSAFYFKSKDTCNLTLVVDVSRNGESYYWRGFETKAFYKEGKWAQFIAVWERPEFARNEDDISIFIWNLNHCNCMLDDFSIRNFADSDYNYY